MATRRGQYVPSPDAPLGDGDGAARQVPARNAVKMRPPASAKPTIKNTSDSVFEPAACFVERPPLTTRFFHPSWIYGTARPTPAKSESILMRKRKNDKQANPSPASLERCPCGVDGLDEVLSGGLPSNCFYLIQGDPGSGKTTLALQFLLEGVRRGESVFYITLSETRDE